MATAARAGRQVARLGMLTGRTAVLLQLESSLPFGFFEKEKAEFDKHPDILKRKWSVLLMPTMFLVICGVWLGALICS